MTTAKEEARRILDQLPDDSSWEDIQTRIQTREQMERRLIHRRNPRFILIAFGISLLLHMIFAGFSRRYTFYDGGIAFQKSPGTTPRMTLERYRTTPDVVNNPSARAQDRPPESARLASDRNAEARDRGPRNLPKTDTPYSRGDVADAYNLFPGGGKRGEGGTAREARSRPESRLEGQKGDVNAVPDDQVASAESAKDFASYLKRGGDRAVEREVYGPGFSRGPTFQNERGRGGGLSEGDISFSTYAWDYAPYMIRLKQLIEAHMYPPAAFSMYGLIDGRNSVRFRIGRDGKLLGAEVLGFEGSKLLVETSTQALELCNPFPPLPPDFPDPVLEVTGMFRYEVIKGGR